MGKTEAVPIRLVVLFDANLPQLMECTEVCRADPQYLCRHRVDPDVVLLVHRRSVDNGATDLGVVRYFLRFIAHLPRLDLSKARLVILTRDKSFRASAQCEYEYELAPWEHPIHFERTTMSTVIRATPVTLEVVRVRGNGKKQQLLERIFERLRAL